MMPGQRYLFLSYGQFHTSGVFQRITELGPGAIVVEVSDATAVGETGAIQTAQLDEVYTPDQSGPLHGNVLIPWHDIARILIQGKPS